MKQKLVFFILLFPLLLLSSAWIRSEDSNEVFEKKREALGKKLFFDTILSADFSVSCSSCHKPEYAFADTVAFSKGVGNALTARNTPSAMNMKFREIYFWDGRANTLEEQALFPLENPAEMNLNRNEAVKRLRASAFYQKEFYAVYKEEPSLFSLTDALGAYERSLETSNSFFDLYAKGDSLAISASAKRGQFLFNEKGHCFDCHFGPDFTGDEFRNIGTYNGNNLKDAGRFDQSKLTADLGKFKVPGLRNVALTAPYMHNGMFSTLRQVIDYYSEPKSLVTGSINVDPIIGDGFHFNEQEKIDLENFLLSLTDTSLIRK